MYDVKQDLIEIFRYAIRKLKNDGCTQEEMVGVMKAISENVPLSAELDDIAAFYGQSKTAVSSQIKRKLIAKPKKNVTLYPFLKILEIIPEKWRKKR